MKHQPDTNFHSTFAYQDHYVYKHNTSLFSLECNKGHLMSTTEVFTKLKEEFPLPMDTPSLQLFIGQNCIFSSRRDLTSIDNIKDQLFIILFLLHELSAIE